MKQHWHPYRAFCQQLALPLADRVTGRQVAKKLRFLQGAQWWTEDQIREYQNRKLMSVIRYAYENTPHFQNVLDRMEMHPGQFRCIEDLVHLPVMSKSIIRKEGAQNLVVGDPSKLVRYRTSGSTGEQGTFYFSRTSDSLTYAAVLLFFSWAGFQLGDRHALTGMTINRGWEKAIKDFLFRCYYISAFDLTDAQIRTVIRRLKSHRIGILAGYASSLHTIASFLNANRETVPLQSVISLGDMLYDHYRINIETAFDCMVHDTYGCCEGFQVAAQCSYGTYHVCMPLTLIEIVDEHGRQLENGQTGRGILTRLDENPMPLIRYEVGDIATLSTKSNCPCGRSWQILDSLQGRDTDVVLTRNGHRLIVHFFTAIFEHEPSVQQFQVVQHDLNSIDIAIVPTEEFDPLVQERLRTKIAQHCSNDIQVQFQIVNHIPATASGKRRFVVSHINPLRRVERACNVSQA
ncbi:MAG: hypothetical protein R3C28_26485 [Pirellulaceae bacterium]